MAKKYRTFIKLAAQAGPVVYAVARRLAPQIRRLMAENPAAFAGLTDRFGAVVGKQPHKTPKGPEQRCQVLREQVTFLYASAANSDAAKQAIMWRNELESIERGLPVLKAMSGHNRVLHKRRISKRLDHLSAEILTASLIGEVEYTYEDATVVEPETTSKQDRKSVKDETAHDGHGSAHDRRDSSNEHHGSANKRHNSVDEYHGFPEEEQ